MKKVLGIALAIIMLLSCVPTAFAAVGANASCKIEIVPTATTYNNGDIVTFNVNLESDPNLLGNMGTVSKIQIGFNSDVFEFIEDISSMPNINNCSTAVVTGYNIENNCLHDFSFPKDGNVADLTEADTAKGWDKILHMEFSKDPTVECDDDYSAGGTAFAFKLKVKDAAAAGTYSVGVLQNGKTIIDEEVGAINEDPELAADLGVDKVFNLIDAQVTIGSVASSFIKDGGAQIRFRGIGSTGTVADYQDEFDVRTVATISQDDFVANFGSDENAIAKITDIGFVYATAANVPTFDLATAKAVAEGTASEGYVKKAVQSIQHAADGEVYKFTCLIENIADADKEQTVNALAYVCFDGTYYYFDAAATVDFAALYERMPK